METMEYYVKKNVSLLMLIILWLYAAEEVLCQKNSIHLLYKPESYTILDSTTLNETEYNLAEVAASIAGFDSMEVVITPRYVITFYHSKSLWRHTVYNRKTSIIRNHVRSSTMELFSEDSVMHYLHKDRQLRQNATRLRDTLLIRDHPGMAKTIHKTKCRLITQPAYGWFSDQPDSIWLTKDRDFPALGSPSFYYLVRGLPLEFVKNDGLMSVRVTSSKSKRSYQSEDVLMVDSGNSPVKQLQSQNRIKDVPRYVLDFKSRLN